MTKIKLNGSVRKDLGTASSNKLRKQGKIPCVIYNDKGENIYISISSKEFEREYRKENIQIRPIEIKTEDKIYNVFVYGLDTHPVSDFVVHVDFINAEGKKEMKIKVPVEIKGKEKGVGLKRGGYLNLIKRKVQLWCSPEKVPSKITVDVSKLHIGETLKADQVKFPEGTHPVNKKNFVLLSITGRGKSTEDKRQEATAEAEATSGEEAKTGERQ